MKMRAIFATLLAAALMLSSCSNDPVSQSGAVGIDVLSHPVQEDAAIPVVVEVPRPETDIEFEKDAADMDVMMGYLEQRLAGAGISLSPGLMYRICNELGGEFFVYYCGYTWVQYGDFGLLFLIRPTGKADTCYVFEGERFKGFIDPLGGFDPQDCLVTFGDDVWLKSYRISTGTGLNMRDDSWYRITSNGLHCELEYTSYYSAMPLFDYYIFYYEEVTGIELGQNGSSTPMVKTKSSFAVQDGYDTYTFQFSYDDVHSYYLSPSLPSRSQSSDFTDRHHILVDNQQQILDLMQNGTQEQKESIYMMLKGFRVHEAFESAVETAEVYEVYDQWYQNYIQQ